MVYSGVRAAAGWEGGCPVQRYSAATVFCSAFRHNWAGAALDSWPGPQCSMRGPHTGDGADTQFLVAVGAVTFAGVNCLAGRLVPPSARTTPQQRWKWRNVATSLVHRYQYSASRLMIEKNSS